MTTSGNYLPEVDGLRFLAISMVVAFHAWGYYRANGPPTSTGGAGDHLLVHRIVSSWDGGVQLFFVISGFILGVPFARHALLNERRVMVREYFLRRLTRLEPPYVLALLLLFVASIAIGKYSFRELFPSLLASLVYLHNIVFQSTPLVMVVAWSLEVEVQFYVLAPLIALVFRLSLPGRRALLLSAIVTLPIVQWLYPAPFLSIYSFLQFFLAGFLLADIHTVNTGKESATSWWGFPVGIVLLASVLSIDPKGSVLSRVAHPLLLLGLCYAGLFLDFWRRTLGNAWLSVIGGMCYSIYLLHFALISLCGRILVRWKPSEHFLLNFVACLSIQSLVILGLSGTYFYFVEKPCMRRDWYKNLSIFRRRAAMSGAS